MRVVHGVFCLTILHTSEGFPILVGVLPAVLTAAETFRASVSVRLEPDEDRPQGMEIEARIVAPGGEIAAQTGMRMPPAGPGRPSTFNFADRTIPVSRSGPLVAEVRLPGGEWIQAARIAIEKPAVTARLGNALQ